VIIGLTAWLYLKGHNSKGKGRGEMEKIFRKKDQSRGGKAEKGKERGSV